MTTVKAHTLPDFCRRYGVGRTKAYEEINAGRLKARKNGRSTIITEDDAQAWLSDLPAWSPPHLDLGRPAAVLPPTAITPAMPHGFVRLDVFGKAKK